MEKIQRAAGILTVIIAGLVCSYYFGGSRRIPRSHGTAAPVAPAYRRTSNSICCVAEKYGPLIFQLIFLTR
jgi:hypothetical protein